MSYGTILTSSILAEKTEEKREEKSAGLIWVLRLEDGAVRPEEQIAVKIEDIKKVRPEEKQKKEAPQKKAATGGKKKVRPEEKKLSSCETWKAVPLVSKSVWNAIF